MLGQMRGGGEEGPSLPANPVFPLESPGTEDVPERGPAVGTVPRLTAQLGKF